MRGGTKKTLDTKNNQKPKKCWYCEHIAECDKFEPCERFKKWRNPNTLTAFCRRYKLNERTVYRWIRKSVAYAEIKISQKTGVKVIITRDNDMWEIEEDLC